MSSYMEYVSIPTVLQIEVPKFARSAVLYDPILKQLTQHEVELIGLTDISTEEEPLLTPCYMCSNGLGTFFIPDLEPTFIQYLKPGEDVEASSIKDKIKEITAWWSTASKDIEPVKVETRGKISFIKRKEKDDDKD